MVSGASTDEPVDERRLVESARRDAGAFAEIYRLYVDRIHAYCYRRSGSRTVAEDVTSATFEKALQGIDSYTWREPGIGPWLFRIASHELVNEYRLVQRQQRIGEAVSSAHRTVLASGSTADQVGAADEVLTALGALRPRYQRALSLRYFADLTNEEAAAAMDVSRATMAVVVHRAGAALRRTIEASRQEEVTSHDR